MRHLLRRGVFAYVLLYLAILLGKAGAAVPSEQLLSEINQLSPSERQARLVKGAKEEGSVVWYVAMNRNESNDIKIGFEAEYPFLRLELVSGRSRDLVSRLMAETRGRKYIYDVANANSLYLNSLIEAKAVGRNRLPYRDALRDGFYDKEGFYNGIFSTPLVFAYNTKMVSSREAPQTIDDLLQPKWKGKLAIDENSYDWLMPIIDYYGEQKGKEIAGRLGNQQLIVGRGQSLMGQLLAAGEFPINVAAYHNIAFSLKKMGAPVDYVLPKPFVPVKPPISIYLSSNPPHPHAAALLIDFLQSKKAQDVGARNYGRWGSRKDCEDPDGVGQKNPFVSSPEKWSARIKEIISMSDTLLLKK
jgi:iron(III) transport system substrate-binding protein